MNLPVSYEAALNPLRLRLWSSSNSSSWALSISVVSIFPRTISSSLTPLSHRTQFLSPLRLILCRSRLAAESEIHGSFNQRMVPASLLTAEKEEAKAVLTLFLKKQGFSNAVAARIVNKSDPFVDHLVARLHTMHKSHYLVGRELTTLEIRDALTPYLETLLDEYGETLVDVVENFPNPPVKESQGEDSQSQYTPETVDIYVSPSNVTLDSKKLKALARVSDLNPTGKLPPHVTYLLELGMELETIREVIRKFPAFAYYSLDRKIKPVVDFLLELGVSKSDIPTIITKRPQLCGISLSENLIPTMTFLENLGVDKSQWAKVIYRFPALLTYSRSKLKGTVDFLYEVGLSAEHVGKVLTRCPNIISYSVDDKLRPAVEYFRSLGVDVALLFQRAPQTFGLSIEANLKPLTEFFLQNGYSIEELRTMISRYGALYTFSLEGNLIPKWEFFLTMGYPKSELVKFPQYFGYSLNERIKPRYAIVKENGVRILLNQVLSLSGPEFDKVVQRKLKKQYGIES
ncbi:OLC1v1020921C1 [Oldenlandia corymbosa var. corymbosa]|uniref:OLC1v1020921C1 n=1 Tax=Oldenlandia corymbosa var. corymbosa TaxID=529605 RepID=A0AAV1BV44_OLDCO|nr:OLC1v1020921C1 [Oldenlandia corymbosa var. corymbosa]